MATLNKISILKHHLDVHLSQIDKLLRLQFIFTIVVIFTVFVAPERQNIQKLSDFVNDPDLKTFEAAWPEQQIFRNAIDRYIVSERILDWVQISSTGEQVSGCFRRIVDSDEEDESSRVYLERELAFRSLERIFEEYANDLQIIKVASDTKATIDDWTLSDLAALLRVMNYVPDDRLITEIHNKEVDWLVYVYRNGILGSCSHVVDDELMGWFVQHFDENINDTGLSRSFKSVYPIEFVASVSSFPALEYPISNDDIQMLMAQLSEINAISISDADIMLQEQKSQLLQREITLPIVGAKLPARFAILSLVGVWLWVIVGIVINYRRVKTSFKNIARLSKEDSQIIIETANNHYLDVPSITSIERLISSFKLLVPIFAIPLLLYSISEIFFWISFIGIWGFGYLIHNPFWRLVSTNMPSADNR